MMALVKRTTIDTGFSNETHVPVPRRGTVLCILAKEDTKQATNSSNIRQASASDRSAQQKNRVKQGASRNSMVQSLVWTYGHGEQLAAL